MQKVIRYTIKDSSLGSLLIAQGETGICAILIDNEPAMLIENLQACFPDASIDTASGNLERLAVKVAEFIAKPKFDLDIPLELRGTDFQRRVWASLQKIPSGQTASYTDIAKKLNTPHAARAVAGACAANLLAVVIPCHRVVRSDGQLSGYRWGIERKQRLLEIEGAR